MEQIELSNILGFSNSGMVSKWCLNKTKINKKYLQKISELFNVEKNLIEPQKRE